MNMSRASIILMSATLILCVAPCAHSESSRKSGFVVTNQLVQAEIQRIVEAYDPQDPSADGELFVARFMQFEGFDKKALLLQVLISSKDKENSIIKRVLIGRLAESIPENDLVEFTVACLKEANEPYLKSNLRRVLDTVTLRGGRCPDFSVFEVYLKDESTPSSIGILVYMFGLHPEEALRTMARIHEDKECEEVIAAKSQKSNNRRPDLSAFSAKKKWWRDLYIIAEARRSTKADAPFDASKLQNQTDLIVGQVANGLGVSLGENINH